MSQHMHNLFDEELQRTVKAGSSGAESALSRASLSTAVKTMRMMTDAAGSPLSIEPKYLLVPPSLEVTAFELCYSDSIPGQAKGGPSNRMAAP